MTYHVVGSGQTEAKLHCHYCGYAALPPNTCPKCGRSETDGEYGFQRIRRITGYLVGTLDRFNNAKRAEVRDRVKHSIVTEVKLEAKD